MTTGTHKPWTQRLAAALSRTLPVFVVAVGIAIGAAPLIPPAPIPATAGPSAFSAHRAMEHVTQIAQEPHPIGSVANAEVREYLVDELTALGLPPELQTVTVADYFGISATPVEVVNVMARIPGNDPTKAIVLIAHYDSDPPTPGANDNAAAVAALLESARALLARPTLRNDVVLLLTDGEEPAPRFGSRAFVDGHPWADDVGLVVNFEAGGGAGPSLLAETSAPSDWLIGRHAATTARPAAFSFLPELARLIGELGTDFDPFRERGYPGLHFAYIADPSIYHTPDDNISSVNLGGMQHHGDHAISLTTAFGDVDLQIPAPEGPLVFFTVGSAWLVRYPVGLAAPLGVATTIILGIALMRRRNTGPRAVLRGILAISLGLGAATIIATVLWRLVTSLITSPSVAQSYLLLMALLAVSALVLEAARRVARRRGAPTDWATGVVMLWVILALVTGTLLPGTSYVFVWPALAGALVLLLIGTTKPPKGWGRITLLVGVTMPTLIVTIPVIDTYFQLAQPRPGNLDSEIMETIAVAILIAGLAIELIRLCFTSWHPAPHSAPTASLAAPSVPVGSRT